MAIIKVQGPLNAVGGNSVHLITKAYGTNVTSGNFLVAVCNGLDFGSGSGAVSDSLNGSWLPATTWLDPSSFSIEGGIFYKANTAGGATPTVTLTLATNSQYPDLTIYEFSGVATSSLTDGANQASGTSAAPASGSITTANSADLLIGGAGTTGTGITAGTPSWTGAVTGNGGWSQYYIVNSATSYNATFTSSNDIWGAFIAAFKAASGAGTIYPSSGNPASSVATSLSSVRRILTPVLKRF